MVGVHRCSSGSMSPVATVLGISLVWMLLRSERTERLIPLHKIWRRGLH